MDIDKYKSVTRMNKNIIQTFFYKFKNSTICIYSCKKLNWQAGSPPDLILPGQSRFRGYCPTSRLLINFVTIFGNT